MGSHDRLHLEEMRHSLFIRLTSRNAFPFTIFQGLLRVAEAERTIKIDLKQTEDDD